MKDLQEALEDSIATGEGVDPSKIVPDFSPPMLKGLDGTSFSAPPPSREIEEEHMKGKRLLKIIIDKNTTSRLASLVEAGRGENVFTS